MAQVLVRGLQNWDVLAMVSSDGRVQERLVSSEGDVQEPAWSPF